jgi:hypothetical protein
MLVRTNALPILLVSSMAGTNQIKYAISTTRYVQAHTQAQLYQLLFRSKHRRLSLQQNLKLIAMLKRRLQPHFSKFRIGAPDNALVIQKSVMTVK